MRHYSLTLLPHPILFFLSWAVVFTFPLIAHLGDAVTLTRGGDAWLHMWDLWWVDKSLVGLHHNPYHTNYLLFPTGLNLYYHSLDLFNGLLSIPLQHLFGLTASYNLLMLANLTMDGLAAYWLCLDRTQSQGASLVGGALFAAAPLLGTSVDLGQLDEVTVWWVPFYIIALWRALDSPGPVWSAGGGRRATLVAGICLAGASLATWYFTAGMVVFTALFVPAYLLGRRTKDEGRTLPNRPSSFVFRPSSIWLQPAIKVAAAAGLFVLLLSPLLVAMVRERLSGATYMLPALTTTLSNSADPVALFLPPRVRSDINQHGDIVALGYVAIALSMAGLALHWRKLWPVGLALLALLVMALGPQLQINGVQTDIPLPYALLNDVPFIGASRQPLRLLATAAACLSLLSAFGMVSLMGYVKSPWRRAVVPALLGLVVLELFGVPRTLASTASGPAYTFIKDSKASGAVFEVPIANWAALSMLHETYHGRPIVGGYTSRHFPYPFADTAPGVAQLVHEDPDPLTAPDILMPSPLETALGSLDFYDIRFVAAHKADLATGREGALEKVIGALFTDKDKAYEDSDVIVYQVPAQANNRSDTLPLVGLGKGWYKVEQNPAHRWTGSNGTDGNGAVSLNIPPGAQGHYRLKLNVYAYKSPRTLSVLINGNRLLTKQVSTAFEDVDVDLGTLTVGNYDLLLQVKEPPENVPGDQRKLGIGVTRLSVERVGNS